VQRKSSSSDGVGGQAAWQLQAIDMKETKHIGGRDQRGGVTRYPRSTPLPPCSLLVALVVRDLVSSFRLEGSNSIFNFQDPFFLRQLFDEFSTCLAVRGAVPRSRHGPRVLRELDHLSSCRNVWVRRDLCMCRSGVQVGNIHTERAHTHNHIQQDTQNEYRRGRVNTNGVSLALKSTVGGWWGSVCADVMSTHRYVPYGTTSEPPRVIEPTVNPVRTHPSRIDTTPPKIFTHSLLSGPFPLV
jgi:hypothetical protein